MDHSSHCAFLFTVVNIFLGTAHVIFKMVFSLILVLREKSEPCLVSESKPNV